MGSNAIHGLGEGERTRRVEGAWGWGERRGEVACEQGGGNGYVTCMLGTSMHGSRG